MRYALVTVLSLFLAGGPAAHADDFSPAELEHLKRKLAIKQEREENQLHYARQLRLAEAESLIAQGPITSDSHVWGGILSIVPGFGVGHAVQGRYFSRGLLFSAGEALGLTLAFAGNRRTGFGISGPVSTVGLVTFATFKVWEIIDAWIFPLHHNQKLHELEKRVATRWSLTPIGPAVPDGIPGPVTATVGATFSLWLWL